MKHFDLFSGYGGFTLALEKVYANNRTILQESTAKDLHEVLSESESGQARTIGFSEIDKYASSVLKYHWPNTKNYGDITKINWSEVPDFDLLTGGSPCQDLSIAGNRAGLAGSRSGLFFEYMRAVKEKRPKYFIWENVKGALSSNRGFDFGTVILEMAEAGYSLWWQVLNAKDFGVPQNRERIFIVGFREGCPREVFFKRQDGDLHNEQEPSQSSCLKSPLRSQGDNAMIEITKNVSDAQIIYNPDGIGKTLKGCGGGQGAKTGLYAIPEATATGYAIATEGDSINLQAINSKTRRGRVGKGVANTLDTSMQQHTIINSRIRRLTPTECERLMGLPDGWTEYGADLVTGEDGKLYLKQKEISDSQRYKLCGNGVVVNVVEEIIKALILSEATEKPSYGNNNLTT